jgi:YVTN family beta-propeller protein
MVAAAFVLGAPSGCSREDDRPRPAAAAIPATSSAGHAAPAAARDTSYQGDGYLFVSNEGAGNISVIDGTTDDVVATIAVGKRPRGLRVSPDGRWLFVALSGSARGGPGVDEKTLPAPDRSQDGIGLIDLSRGRLVARLPSGPDPETFDISPDGRSLYVSNEDSAQLSILDVESRKITATVGVGGEPEGVTLSPDGRFAYVASEADNRVDVVDTSRRVLTKSIPAGTRPRVILFTRDGARAFVSAELGSAIDVLDARKHARAASIKLPAAEPGVRNKPLPMGLALSPDESTLYVSTGRGGGIAVIDTATSKLSGTFTGVGSRPWGIALGVNGRKLYTANGPSDDVSVVDAASGAILKRIPTGRLPWGIVRGGAAPPPQDH